MSPNEAADVLGVAPTAPVDEVQRAYAAKLAEAGDDEQRRDAVTAARDALLAASAWQAPSTPIAPPAAQAPTAPVDAYPQHPGYAPPPNGAVPQPPYAPVPPQPGYGPGGPAVPPQPPYPAGSWYAAPPPARRGLSTGAIVGITLGSIAVALVILIVVFVGIFAVAHESSRLAGSDIGSSAAPYDDSSDDPSQGGDSASGQDYDVDGVHVHNVDGWTFELTADQACSGAQITAGFSDSPDGDDLDQWTTIVDLEAGVPFTLTIPDSASDYDYVGIETVDCTQA